MVTGEPEKDEEAVGVLDVDMSRPMLGDSLLFRSSAIWDEANGELIAPSF